MDEKVRVRTGRKRRKKRIIFRPLIYLLGVGLGVWGWHFFYAELKKSSGFFAWITELVGYGHFRPQEALLPDSLLGVLYQLSAVCLFALLLYFISRHEAAHLLSFLGYHFRIAVVYLSSLKKEGFLAFAISFLPSLLALTGMTILIRGVRKKKHILGLVGILIVAGAFGACFKIFNFVY